MTQSNIFQFAVPTGDDERPLYRMTAREWVAFVANVTVPHAHKPPRVKISNEYSAPGTDNLLAFFHCQVDRRMLPVDHYRKRDDELYPEVMAALFSVTGKLIVDGWWIDHCDLLGRHGRDGKIEPRIIAMRWQEGRVVDSSRWRLHLDPAMPKMEDKVPLRCAEGLIQCGYCNGVGCMFCDYRGITL